MAVTDDWGDCGCACADMGVDGREDVARGGVDGDGGAVREEVDEEGVS